MVALVDDDKFDELDRVNWHVVNNNGIYYAGHLRYIKDKPSKNILMHWCVIGIPSKGMVVDHIDGNGLNNQKSNLRIIHTRQNTQNKHKNYSSKYPGVSKSKTPGKWIAHIKYGSKVHHLGTFTSEEEAFKVYQRMSLLAGQKVISPI